MARLYIWALPVAGRGDWSIWVALVGYVVSAIATIVLCYALLPRNYSLLLFLIFFAFVYNPLISYVNARLLGIAGQTVDIPFIKETSFILFGARGISILLGTFSFDNYSTIRLAFSVYGL